MARFLLIVLICVSMSWQAHRVHAVAAGGLYRNSEHVQLTIDAHDLPRTLGFHVVRGIARYHGRLIRFSSGVFLPAAYFHTQKPMPIVIGLHNKAGIGQGGDGGMIGEGFGQMLGNGSPDGRAEGDRAENPIDLRQDAQFIGVVPLCPAGSGWDNPVVTRMLLDFIDQMVTAYHADDNRVYLTGFSYGASSTWQIALAAPDRFAALICCDGRATADPIHDVAKLSNVPIYLEVGQWDGPFVDAADQMHQALNSLPHRNYVFRMIPGGNHFCYQTVYTDPEVWKWVYAQHRQPATATTSGQ